MVGGRRGANLGIDRYMGGGGTMHFKVMGVGGWPLLLTPAPRPLFLRLWTVYFNWEGGGFYLLSGIAILRPEKLPTF